jgi:hypothetical protein
VPASSCLKLAPAEDDEKIKEDEKTKELSKQKT